MDAPSLGRYLASVPGSRRNRRPKVQDERRVCEEESCTIVLSKYNDKALCFAHQPLKYPRVRGDQRY